MTIIKMAPLAALIAASVAPVHADIFISEYVEGSSNNKAIELFNPSESTIDLANYQLKYYFNGKTDVGYTINLTGEIPAKGTFVVAHSSAAADVLALANQTTGGSWFNGDDAITLENNNAVIDSFGQVGFDPGSYWSNNDVRSQDRSLRRASSVNTGRTDAMAEFIIDEQWESFAKDDFSGLGQHAGGNGGTDPVEPVEPVVCGTEATRIHTIQGLTDISPLDGQVVEVEAVVTADFQADNQLKGFFIQALANNFDNDPMTSEGLFVYHQADDVNVGDLVRIRAKVKEAYNATQLSNVSDLAICGTATSEAVTVNLPVNNAADLEAYEGMRVVFTQPLVVADNYGLGRYGELKLATERLYQSTQIALPGDAAKAVMADNARKIIVLDDGSTAQNSDPIAYPSPELDAYNTLRLGDQVTNIEGVMTYSFNQYRVHPTSMPTFVTNNPRPETIELPEIGDLRIASFNVLNYFNGDGQGAGFPTSRGADSAQEFTRQRDKIITAILALDADVIGLMEMENDGFGEFSAIQDLVNGLNAVAGAGTYAFVNFNAEQVGTDAIMSAMLYRTDRIAETGTAAFTTAVPFDYGNRPPMMQSFTDIRHNDVFSVVVAHLRSKGSCSKATDGDIDSGDGQGCWNATRVQAVNELSAWVATQPTAVDDADVIILGDMNAYALEDPIFAYETNGYTNLKKLINGNTLDYSYVYQGLMGSLDHALASSSMAEKVTGIADWHINADEPIILDYNTEYKSDKHQASLYANNAYRASDHDPIVIEVKTKVDSPAFEGEITNISGWFWWNSYQIDLPAGYDNLSISIGGGTGEADLYVRQGKQASFFKYDCRPYVWGNEETCEFNAPREGKWFIRTRGFLPYSDVTLKYKATKN
ncbi:ExeM/NucH family extracellular endonuclease [Pseudoalteromonas ulvae]|uniref:ExeM/NucH family extracellular endonuclease n=1 Tax=Pseudoalteromonas ulvae TaxID=107327 RepID=UPI0015936C44|nr:ExeM/NucH family extracellular endonuclease [Pseudoalteromonas ulvae]